MKAFLDTSVLVATFYGDHEHHGPSLDVFVRFGKKDTCCATHNLAEVYATLTGMPGKRRVGGDAALLFLGDIGEHLTLVSLDDHEYFQVTEEAASLNLTGGAIYVMPCSATVHSRPTPRPSIPGIPRTSCGCPQPLPGAFGSPITDRWLLTI